MKNKPDTKFSFITWAFITLALMFGVNELVNNPEPGVNQSPIEQPRLIILKVDTLKSPRPTKVIIKEPFVPSEDDEEFDPNDPDADSIQLEYPERAEDYYD